MRRMTQAGLLACAVAAAALGACSRGGANAGQLPGGPRGAPAGGGPVAVTTIRAVRRPIETTLRVGGEIVAHDSVDAFPQIAGKVAVLAVRVGDSVRKGETIAEVDPSKPGQEYARSPVPAPISGTVTAVPVRVGSTVATTTAIATIGRLDELEIHAFVAERFIGEIRVGSQARVSFAAWPGVGFPARVSQISPVVDPESRTLEIHLEFERKDERVKAGMFATVDLITARREAAIVAPRASLFVRGGRTYLYVVEEGRAHVREVSVGLQTDELAEITAGLEAGEEVVATGRSLLTDGATVRVVGTEEVGG